MASDKCTTNKHLSLGTLEGVIMLSVESPLQWQARTVVVDVVDVVVGVVVIVSEVEICGEDIQI